jgi:hypothetical protein
MVCTVPSCAKEAVDTLVYEGRTRPFCEAHYELAKMAKVLLEIRSAIGINPDFETVNAAMERGN